MNIELLRRIQQHNAKYPEQLDMELVLHHRCGTTACIAGHAVLLSGQSVPMMPLGGVLGRVFVVDERAVLETAGTLLDLDAWQADRLFMGSSWPNAVQIDLEAHSSGTPEYAAIVNARIDRFIETGGAE